MTYRGTIGYDEPLKVRRSRLPEKPGVRIYRRVQSDRRNNKEYNRLRMRAWREKNREHVRAYIREYMRKYRKRHKGQCP